MNTYEQMLSDLARSSSDSIISNGNDDHATALITKLFEVADTNVTIFAGPQDEDIYASSEVINAAARFLQTDKAELNLILEGLDIKNKEVSNKFLTYLHNKIGNDIADKVKLRSADTEAKELPYHFILVDERAFRFEPNKKVHEALASFNNKAAAEYIKSSADKLLKRIEPIPFNVNL